MATVSNLDWNGVCQAIASVYGTDAQTVATTLTNNGVALGDVEEAFKMLKGTTYEIWYNSDGTVRSYNYVGMPDTYVTNSSSASVAQSINSNTQVATKTAVKVPLNTTASLTEPTKTSWKAGMTQTGNFILKEILPAVAAANVGITLGKTIDATLYNANPDFWDSHGWGSINPETWNSITQDDNSTLAKVFNTVFKIDPQTNTSQAYLDQDAFAYLAKVLYNLGVFETGNTHVTEEYEPSVSGYTVNIATPLSFGTETDYLASDDGGEYGIKITNNTDTVYTCLFRTSAESNIYTFFISKGQFHVECRPSSGYPWSAWSYNGVYQNSTTTHGEYYVRNIGTNFLPDGFLPINICYPYNAGQSYLIGNDVANYLFYNNVQPTQGDIAGIGTQTGATTPSLDADDTVAEVLTKLQEQYPDLFANAVTQNVVQPDGTIKEYTYIPVSQAQPTANPTEGYEPQEQPISSTSTQANPEVDPETATEAQLEYIIGLLTEIANPNIEVTGEGETPTVIVPTGSAQALYRVWNPTESEINQFGSWLWSSSFVDQLLKVFSDPMQAIIGLHKVFATPSVGGRDTIKVGYLDSNVSSNYVDEQYVTIDCGTVSFPESYNSVFDYSPFTDVSLYLPFIGFVKLNVNDITRGTVTITYHVDVLTGACLAEVSVIRDMFGGVIYTYTGNCSVTYPLSSGSYMGIVGAIAGIAGSIAGTLATGGALAPMAFGATASALNMHTNVERSGSLSGNAGAMGIKKPYFVISRPQTNLAETFEEYLGKPANYTTTLASATGFVACEEVHIENCNATSAELDEIEALLKNGILI